MARNFFKHHIEYIALRSCAAVLRALPRELALRCGAVAGRVASKLLKKRVRLLRDNVSQAFPELDEEQVSELERRNFEQMGISAVESIRLDLFDPAQIHEVFELEGIEHLREAQALGRGVILMTAHLGFWEAGSYVFPALGFPLDIVTKPLKNPLSEAYFLKLRRHFGAESINSRKGARRILKSLKAGRVVGLLLDQHISPPGSIPVDFFGRKAFATTTIASMAMKNQIPVVATFCLRQPDNRYRGWVEPMLLLEGNDDNAVAANTQLLTGIIESAIRRDPAQWFWLHRRWRDKRIKKYQSETSSQ